MEDKEVNLGRKAELLCSGAMHVCPEVRLPFPTSKSSAGPGAGSESIVICFSGSRVKVPISRKGGGIELRELGGGRYQIVRNGKVLIDDATIEPTLCHAPGQAFVSLGRSCVMKCAFCTINDVDAKDELTVEGALELIIATSKRKGFESVAITSGVKSTVDDEVDRLASLIGAVRKELPEIPIGVEPLVTKKEHIARLKKAGATEIKINLEAATKEIFERACPGRDCLGTIKAIQWAVEEFGRGAVTSNVLVGLGESDEDVKAALEMLGEIGSVGNVRAVRMNDLNRERLRVALGNLQPVDKERLMRLARMQKKILKDHGLTTSSFKTMCFPCGCCDLVPGADL